MLVTQNINTYIGDLIDGHLLFFDEIYKMWLRLLVFLKLFMIC